MYNIKIYDLSYSKSDVAIVDPRGFCSAPPAFSSSFDLFPHLINITYSLSRCFTIGISLNYTRVHTFLYYSIYFNSFNCRIQLTDVTQEDECSFAIKAMNSMPAYKSRLNASVLVLVTCH